MKTPHVITKDYKIKTKSFIASFAVYDDMQRVDVRIVTKTRTALLGAKRYQYEDTAKTLDLNAEILNLRNKSIMTSYGLEFKKGKSQDLAEKQGIISINIRPKQHVNLVSVSVFVMYGKGSQSSLIISTNVTDLDSLLESLPVKQCIKLATINSLQRLMISQKRNELDYKEHPATKLLLNIIDSMGGVKPKVEDEDSD
jgi:hypothetical protein